MLSCLGYPECRAVQFFPPCVVSAQPHTTLCGTVSHTHTHTHTHAHTHTTLYTDTYTELYTVCIQCMSTVVTTACILYGLKLLWVKTFAKIYLFTDLLPNRNVGWAYYAYNTPHQKLNFRGSHQYCDIQESFGYTPVYHVCACSASHLQCTMWSCTSSLALSLRPFPES